MALEYLFVDFDSFFASVAQQDRPELRGKPVGVVPSIGVETTCCIAASYEAKARGVRTGTLVHEARRLIPDITFVEGDHARYIEVHHQVMDIIEQCLHVEKRLSIDECYGRLPPHWREPEVVRAKCAEIKAALAEKIGTYITASIGVGPNRFLAKVASAMRKPNGVMLIDLKDLPEVLYPLPLQALNGIGRSMLRRLHSYRIFEMRQLCGASADQLRRVWGSIHGAELYRMLRGEDVAEVETKRQTVSHSHVLAPSLRNGPAALAVMHKQLQKACRRLRAMGYYAGRMTMSVKFNFEWRWEREIRLFPTQDTLTFSAEVNRLWDDRPQGESPTQVRIVLSDLVTEAAHTLSLFEEQNQTRRVTLQRAMDTLNLRYGNTSVFYGASFSAMEEKAAPMRIAFNHIPNVELEGDG